MMTEENIEDLQGKIDNEGYDYAMFRYSNWEDIKDPTFHAIRNKAKFYQQELITYLISHGIDADEF